MQFHQHTMLAFSTQLDYSLPTWYCTSHYVSPGTLITQQRDSPVGTTLRSRSLFPTHLAVLEVRRRNFRDQPASTDRWGIPSVGQRRGFVNNKTKASWIGSSCSSSGRCCRGWRCLHRYLSSAFCHGWRSRELSSTRSIPARRSKR